VDHLRDNGDLKFTTRRPAAIMDLDVSEMFFVTFYD